MVKIRTLLILIVFLVVQVNAEIYRDSVTLDTKCIYEDITLKIIGANRIYEGEYEFIGCEKYKTDGWEWWTCECYSQDTIYFDVETGYNNTYSIMVEYYIAKPEEVNDKEPGQIRPSPTEIRNRNKKRVDYFSDIVVVPEPIDEEDDSLGFPNIDFQRIFSFIMVLIIIFGFIVLIGIRIVRRELKDDDMPKQKKSKKGVPPPGFKELPEDETDDYVNRYL